jgi:hypothetical protein
MRPHIHQRPGGCANTANAMLIELPQANFENSAKLMLLSYHTQENCLAIPVNPQFNSHSSDSLRPA